MVWTVRVGEVNWNVGNQDMQRSSSTSPMYKILLYDGLGKRKRKKRNGMLMKTSKSGPWLSHPVIFRIFKGPRNLADPPSKRPMALEHIWAAFEHILAAGANQQLQSSRPVRKHGRISRWGLSRLLLLTLSLFIIPSHFLSITLKSTIPALAAGSISGLQSLVFA